MGHYKQDNSEIQGIAHPLIIAHNPSTQPPYHGADLRSISILVIMVHMYPEHMGVCTIVLLTAWHMLLMFMGHSHTHAHPHLTQKRLNCNKKFMQILHLSLIHILKFIKESLSFVLAYREII